MMLIDPIEARLADCEDDVPLAGRARRVVAACHGILTRSHRPTWPRKFQRWMNARDPRTLVVADHYFSLPLPRWNWIKNGFLARSVATTLEEWGNEGAEIHLVGHSNGAAVALKAAKLLAARHVPVESLTLIGGAVSCDPNKAGVSRLIGEGWLGRAAAFWSSTDTVIGSPPWPTYWPWGRLGARGWRRDGDEEPVSSPRLFGVQFLGYRHTAYFEPWAMDETFRAIEAVIEGRARETRFDQDRREVAIQ